MSDKNHIETLVNELAINDIIEVDGVKLVIKHPNHEVESLQSYQKTPVRKKGYNNFLDAESFAEYWEKHKTEHSEIHAYPNAHTPGFMALFNAHSAENADWCDFGARYKIELSPEWNIWNNSNKKPKEQVEFAQFIEENLPDITRSNDIYPSSAEMLEISREMEATNKVDFKSVTRLDNGRREFMFQEEIKGTTKSGKITIPEIFEITIPVYARSEAVPIEARLRYRINSGQLVMWYELVRPHKVKEEAFDKLCFEINSLCECKPLICAD